MAFDQFNNMLTVAAALSMAGWIARTPEYLPHYQPFDGDYREDIDYFGQQQHFWQYNNEELVSPLVQTMPVAYHVNDNFHDTKFIADVAPLSELQDLVSWEEAYRRGDLSFASNTNYAYPYIYEGNNEELFTQLQNPQDNYGVPYSSNYDNDSENLITELPSYYDDGYGSGDTNLDSPESSDISSLVSLNLDDISTTSSPSSHSLLDLNDNNAIEDVGNGLQVDVNNELGVQDIPGAVGYSINDSDFDIEKLFSDDYYDLYDAFPRTKEEPPDTVRSTVSDLDYASPLLDPNFDEYLGRFIAPEQHNNLDTSFDDQFQMQFSDQAISDGKFVSDVLKDFDSLSYGATLNGDFPTPYEKTLESDANNNEEVETPAIPGASQNSYAGPSAESIYSPKSNIHLDDHNYAKHFNEEEFMDPVTRNVVDTLASNFYKFHKDTLEEKSPTPPPAQPARTYAPGGRRRTSTKQHKNALFIFPDFPYTSNELIEMHVDDFNDIVSQLDVVRQIVLRDLRKKGKNKFAARSCRKRKLEVIDGLDNNVDLLEKQKEMLLREQQLLIEETRQIHEKTVWLNNYILERLFDENGNSYSDSDYTLEYTTDGNVYLVPYAVKEEGKMAQDV